MNQKIIPQNKESNFTTVMIQIPNTVAMPPKKNIQAKNDIIPSPNCFIIFFIE